MIPINVYYDNIDFCMASAQKGIMGMTGLSYVIGKKDIIEARENFADFKIAEYSTNYEAFESPYGTALRYLTALFSVTTTIP